jgi:hypothetical protein
MMRPEPDAGVSMDSTGSESNRDISLSSAGIDSAVCRAHSPPPITLTYAMPVQDGFSREEACSDPMNYPARMGC